MNLIMYGLQRSGTNFIEKLLRRKYNVRFLNENKQRQSPLHKHFRLYDEKQIIPEPKYKNSIYISSFSEFEDCLPRKPEFYLIISKNPYSWLDSYKRWATKCKWPPATHHYIAEYNLFYKRWLDLAEETDKIYFLKYIDFLRMPGKVLAQIEESLKLKKRLLYPLAPNSFSKVKVSDRFTREKRDYYLNGGYMQHFSSEEITYINNLISNEVVMRLGYRLINHCN